jgi:release factor glutamine methyltransferase
MTFSQLKAHLFATLRNHYSVDEAAEIFYLLLEQNNQMSRLDFALRNDIKAINIDKWSVQLNRLCDGEPVQYILGTADFRGMKLMVNSSVLIPRPETEELVQLIVENENRSNILDILDIGTGSGCIAVSLKKEMQHANVYGLDVSSDALQVAKTNGLSQNVEINWIFADIASFQSTKKYDVIVSNPPYIPVSDKSEMAKNVLDFEPHLALFAPENDPLYFYKQIGDFATTHLKKNEGKLYFEAHYIYAKEVAQYFSKNAYVQLVDDMFGKPRFIVIGY